MCRSMLLAGILVAGLTGCTYSYTGAEPPGGQSTSTPDPGLAAPDAPVTLQGQFQSQGAVTTGTATIRTSASGAVLQLSDFATGPAADLRLALSPGTAIPGPQGDLELSSSTLFELAPQPLGNAGSHRIEISTGMWEAMPKPVRSVVVYNYTDRTVYGTANLTQ